MCQRIGTDCSGVETVIMACRSLGLKHDHMRLVYVIERDEWLAGVAAPIKPRVRILTVRLA